MTEPMSEEELVNLSARMGPNSRMGSYEVVCTFDEWMRFVAIAEDHARLVAECDALKREVGHRKAMQPTDRDDRPITQAAANRLMIIALDDYPALRTQLDKAKAKIAVLRKEREYRFADLTTARERIEKLEEAGATVLRGFEEGAFVRDTRGDGDPAWAIKLLPYLRALAALAATEEEPTP